MKRIIFLLIILGQAIISFAQKGIPFFINFGVEQYEAHSRNFSILCDSYGRVYVANFEGLLYYDQSTWHIIHTPGISRITVLYQDRQQRIWVGGYNVFGYLDVDSVGNLFLHLLSADTDDNRIGEVVEIIEEDEKIKVYTSSGDVFAVLNQSLVKEKTESAEALLKDFENDYYQDYKVNQRIPLETGITLLATSGKGVVAINSDGDEVYVLSEESGLCNNNVNHLAVDIDGNVWGATDNGVFCINASSVYSRFTATQGLKGEVLDIYKGAEGFYVGTLQGLFYQSGNRFIPISQIKQACWELVHLSDGKLLAATSEGLFIVHQHVVKQLTKDQALSVYPDKKGGYYIGELNAIYYLSPEGVKKQIAPVERVNKFLKSDDGTLWVSTMYGEVYHQKSLGEDFVLQETDDSISPKLTADYKMLFKWHEKVYMMSRRGIYYWNEAGQKLLLDTILMKRIGKVYPQSVYVDYKERLWLTNSLQKKLLIVDLKQSAFSTQMQVTPLIGYSVSALCVLPTEIWLGGNFGLIMTDQTVKDRGLEQTSRIFIREVSLGKDSILYGGFDSIQGLRPKEFTKPLVLDSKNNNISFNYSVDNTSILVKPMYRYRLKGNDDWSPWSESTSVQFLKLWYGNYTFEVMAMDNYGRQTEIASFNFTIRYPFYLRWYAITAYVLILGLAIVLLLRFRTHRLMMEKIHLENIVEQRTFQIRSQKEEIEEKSKKLEKALDDLGKAQDSLIRQEKMATVGQLTKGLIDRILNPLNYINNFSHLTRGLVKDIEQNLSDEKDNIDKEVYEDTEDVLSMVNMNLSKIESHGINVTRILKAMEEVLKDRSTVLQPIDLMMCCRKNFEMLNTYYAKDIKDYHIHTEFNEQLEFVAVNANAEQLSKTVMSLLANSIYAVKKKFSQNPYDAVIRLSVDLIEGKQVYIHIYDNGIGIEDTIIERIFDPFFTTKTTGEAAGVGLFLSREIILNHNGTITVHSQKNEYTEFIISLPLSEEGISAELEMVN